MKKIVRFLSMATEDIYNLKIYGTRLGPWPFHEYHWCSTGFSATANISRAPGRLSQMNKGKRLVTFGRAGSEGISGISHLSKFTSTCGRTWPKAVVKHGETLHNPRRAHTFIPENCDLRLTLLLGTSHRLLACLLRDEG